MDRVSSEYSQDPIEAEHRPTFEETYPRYEFAEMVRIGLVLAESLAAGATWLAKMSCHVRAAHFGLFSKRSATEMPPAE
jgi:hypothetical protein